MRSRWVVWCAGSVLFAISCGESEESGRSTGSGGDSGTGATSSGTGEVLTGMSPPARWVMSATGCVPASLSADSRYVAVGARLEPAAFMAGELRVE